MWTMTRRLCLLISLLTLLTSGLFAQQRPYVVLVSLDGFRNDYAERYHAANLQALGKAGAVADAMIPSFPTVTFPNHISIVTGMYPGHHGIVGNSFFDPARKEQYGMRNSAVDGSWYRAKPLWVVAEEQHVKSAAMFWPTADAETLGVRPTYWSKYDGKVPNEERVAQVLAWLKLPEAERPHFITLYFSDVDSAGHSHGPESPETEAAVQRVDKLIGELWSGIQATSLPVNLVVVSDHGMQLTNGFVNLSDYTDLSAIRVVFDGPVALLYALNAEAAEKAYADLKGKSPKFDVFRRAETPKRWHYSEDPRIGDLVVVAKDPVSLVKAAPTRTGGRGEHGFDVQDVPTMKAIFYAAGPNVRPGSQVKPFENVDVFPFITKILGLKNPPDIDGSEKTLTPIYVK